MPMASIHFTPKRRKSSGINSMKAVSDIWPRLIRDDGFGSTSTTALLTPWSYTALAAKIGAKL